MITHLGRLMFGLGIVLGIALAAPVPKWDATREALTPVVERAQAAALPVIVEPVSAGDEKLAAEWQTRLKQLLELEGIATLTREEMKPGVNVLALKATLGDESLRAMLYAEGEAGPVASADLVADPKWPRTTLPWMLFAFVGAVGVALWRYGVKQAALAGLEESSEDENPFALLARLLPVARRLGEDLPLLNEQEVTQRIDELLDGYVLPLAVVRQKVIDRLGMKSGSEILIVLAYGERMLNRVWSAASDGYLHESHLCYPDALAALEEGNRLAKAALEGSYSTPRGAGGHSGAPVAVKESE